MLERACLIDTCNNWLRGTLKAYQSKYNVIGSFEYDFGVVVLPKTIPIYPPPRRPSHQTHVGTRTLIIVPRQLAEETRYSRRNHQVRHLARSPLYCISFLDVESPANTVRQIHVRLVATCSPTDQAAYTYFTEGMRGRLGNHPRRSAVLTGKHMMWIDRYYANILRYATTRESHHLICTAGVTHLLSYLGWLRALETFGIRWWDLRQDYLLVSGSFLPAYYYR
jgi:hypothetical protein